MSASVPELNTGILQLRFRMTAKNKQRQKQEQRQRQKQIPYGNDKKSKGKNSNSDSRFPAGMTNQKSKYNSSSGGNSNCRVLYLCVFLAHEWVVMRAEPCVLEELGY